MEAPPEGGVGARAQLARVFEQDAARDRRGLIWFIWSVWSIWFNQNKRDRPNRPNEQDRLADLFSILLNASGRLGRRRGDDSQKTVAELPSVILRRSSWLSKKMMPRSVLVSYRRFTSVSNPLQLKNLTGPPAICPGVRSSEP